MRPSEQPAASTIGREADQATAEAAALRHVREELAASLQHSGQPRCWLLRRWETLQ